MVAPKWSTVKPVPPARKLTTTSFAILGLLAVRSWSAYELAKQMQRSLRFIWPRAQSAIYEEPKHLVAQGLARVRQEPSGANRTRARYAITAKGRRAFAAWLAEPSAPPQFESEAAVRTMFAEHGRLQDLRRTIEGVRAHADETQRLLAAVGESWLADAPYPERMHVAGLVGRLSHEQAAALRRWADWALDEVGRWPSTGPDAAPRGRVVIEANLRDFSLGATPIPRSSR